MSTMTKQEKIESDLKFLNDLVLFLNEEVISLKKEVLRLKRGDLK